MNTIAQRKAQAIESLSSQFSHDSVSMEEYERLVEYINRAETERELSIIEKMIADNARLSKGFAQPAMGSRQSGIHLRDPLSDDWSAGIFTLLSSRITTGQLLQKQQSFITIMANHTITISATDLPPGRTVIDIVNILGTTTIFVEPGITVRIAANPVLGSIEVARGIESQARIGKPELLITGVALCGVLAVRLA